MTGNGFKGGPSDLASKILQNTKKSSLYSQSILIIIHKTAVAEGLPITREIRDLLRPRSTNGKHGLFLHEQLVHLHNENTQTKLQT